MIQQVLIAQIESDATLLAAFGRRIYPVVLPNRVQFPAIVYYVPTMPISHTMQGAGTIDQATVHLIVYADTYLEAWAAANVLRAALDGQAGTWGDTKIGACLLDDMGKNRCQVEVKVKTGNDNLVNLSQGGEMLQAAPGLLM